MSTSSDAIGTVISDDSSPTFEIVRVKLKAQKEVAPGTLLRIPVKRNGKQCVLIGRVRGAYEHNPHEGPEDVSVRDTLAIDRNYPQEEDSTTIYRLVEVDLIEELEADEMQAPSTLPNSGTEVFVADQGEVVRTLGLAEEQQPGLEIGDAVGGIAAKVKMRREAIQRHFFICGTTGSGKSYAMGVIAEELVAQGLPLVFIDTQDEYSTLVTKLGGAVKRPGHDFTIRISSLTESELLDLLPKAMQKSDLQCDIVARAFGELQSEQKNELIPDFTLDDLLVKIGDVAPLLTAKEGDVPRAIDATRRRTGALARHRIFGEGVKNWMPLMYPCLSIRCKHLVTSQLQPVATAVLRELQTLRLHGHVPPYVAVVDEAHLFVPEGEDSPCKQIIREGVRIGRHHGIAFVLLTQSPVDIDKRAIRQCNTRLVFALEPDQLDAIRGVKADASEEMLRALPKMPAGTCLLSGTYESVKHTIPVKIRKRKTADSEGGKAPDIFAEMENVWLPELDPRGAKHDQKATCVTS